MSQGGVVYSRTFTLYKTTDYLGQKKSLSFNYDTNMKVEVTTESGEALSTFTVSGIDEIAASDLATKANVTKPRVTLSFELSRSGLLQLNKAEAKVDETYWVDLPPPKPAKKTLANNTTAASNTTAANDTTTDSEGEAKPEESETLEIPETKEEEEAPVEEEPKPERVQRKRSIPYTLSRIERVNHGLPSLSREQLQKAKDRLRWYERRDEERARTDKAKNDFESVLYAMRDWLSDSPDEHMPYVGSLDQQEAYLAQIAEA